MEECRGKCLSSALTVLHAVQVFEKTANVVLDWGKKGILPRGWVYHLGHPISLLVSHKGNMPRNAANGESTMDAVPVLCRVQ